MNLAFRIDPGEEDANSSVKLLEARKGEKKELVNFITVPSAIFDGAFRFEAAYRPGYFLAFRPPTALRMVPYADQSNLVVDFSLVDFAEMFKFIDIEEVLKPVMDQSG